MEISIGSLLEKVAGLKPEGRCRPQAWRPATLLKKDSKNCFPVKFVKFLRAPDFKEHLRTTACESKPLRCIVLIKAMANIASRVNFSFNYHLLFEYSRFNSTIFRNLFPCNSANNIKTIIMLFCKLKSSIHSHIFC